MSPKRYFLVLILLCLLLIGFSAFLPLLSYQEVRRALIVQESFLNRTFIPTLNGEPYFTKPPLYTWLTIPLFALGHIWEVEIFSLRFFSILCYIGTSYLLYLILQRNLSKTLLALLILFSSFRFTSFIYRIDLEPLFIFFTTLSFYFFLRYRNRESTKDALLFYISFALAFLVRGPLHFFLIPAFFLISLLTKEKAIFRLLFFFPGWVSFILIVSPWFLYGYLTYGKEVFQQLLHTDIGERLFTRSDPFYYYFKAFALNFLPFILLLLWRIKILRETLREFSSEDKVYLASFIVPLILLSITGEKFDKYLLFLYPISALFFTNILLRLYNEKFLYTLGIVLVTLNLSIIILSNFYHREELLLKTALWKKTLSPKKECYLYREFNPLAPYILKRPCPLLKEVIPKNNIKTDSILLSPTLINEITPKFVLPDPYKRGKIWYVYVN